VSRGYLHALRHQRLGANDGLFAHPRAVQNHRAHAHEHFIADRARMDYGAVTNGDPVADNARILVGKVHHGVVLDVSVMTHGNAVDIAAQDGAAPDTGLCAEGYIANDYGRAGEINAPAKLRRPAQESVQLFYRVLHEKKLTTDYADVADFVKKHNSRVEFIGHRIAPDRVRPPN